MIHIPDTVDPWFFLPYWHCACAQDFCVLSVLSVLEVFVNVNTFLSKLLERQVLIKRFPPFVPLFLNR